MDAAGFLLLAHLFTAHMSGNSAAMGAYFGQGSWREALHRATPVPFFVLGVGFGAALTEVACRRALRSPLALVLGIQAAVLIALLMGGARLLASGGALSGGYIAAAGLPSFAMGLQNATLRRVGAAHIRTTFVSGMLTDCAESFVAWLFGPPGGARRALLGRALLYGAIWAAFSVGAVCGSLATGRWAFHALLLPVGALAGIAAWDAAAPLTTAGEMAPAGEGCRTTTGPNARPDDQSAA